MDIYKILVFAMIGIVLLCILKQYNPGYGVLVSIGCCVVILMAVLNSIGPILSFADRLAAFTVGDGLSCVLKAVAISLLAQSVQDLCLESGQTALAGRVELAGKTAVLLAALPLFSRLADILLELLR